MDQKHINAAFDQDLNQVDTLILKMGGLVEAGLGQTIEVLRQQDIALAEIVIKQGDEIAVLAEEVNKQAIRVLALRQPVAGDLRNVVMALKISGHLARIGNYSRNIAKRYLTITQFETSRGGTATLVRMGKRVQNMLKNALDAYNRRDSNLAEDIRNEDEHVDQMLNTLFRELLTYMMEDPRYISGGMHLIFMAKNFERIGDHSVEVAQEIIYLVTGRWPDQKRSKNDKTSSIFVKPQDIKPEK